MKRSIVVLAFAAAVLGALAIRVVVEGRTALADGDELVERGQVLEGIRAYETAARWYLPLAPHVDAAYGKLRTIAERAAPDQQLAAWRAIRAAARATRWIATPHADDLAAADRAIASISAGLPEAATPDPAWHRERLARDPRPRAGACVLASLGILLWLGGVIGLVRRGVDPAGRLVRRPALVAGIASLVGLACWALGLYNA